MAKSAAEIAKTSLEKQLQAKLPHHTEAESSLIGGLMMDPNGEA